MSLWLPGMPLPTKVDSQLFRCPVCRKTVRQREPMEPLCTGPNEALNEHEPTLMTRCG